MSSRLFSFSLALNLVLLGVAGYWAVTRNSGAITTTEIAPTSQTNRLIVRSLRQAPAAAATASSNTSLRWSDLESEDYPTYIANLRRAGCPEPVLRRIIIAEIKELYAQKAFALAQDFHRDFWNIAAQENVQAYFEKTLGQQIKALANESDAMLKKLVGESSLEPSSTKTSAVESRLTDFLPPHKQDQLRWVTERYETKIQAVQQANLSLAEKAFQTAKFREEMEREQARIFSPEEWAEFQLRQSSAASEIQQLPVDFTVTEMRNLAKAIHDYNRQPPSDEEANAETLEQKLQAVLGPARFNDFDRARSASYRELYEVASDFGRPPETAAEIFELRLASEKQSDEIRADRNRTPAEKQALLDQLHDQVEQTVITKFGAEAYQSYRSNGGRWIHSLGRL